MNRQSSALVVGDRRLKEIGLKTTTATTTTIILTTTTELDDDDYDDVIGAQLDHNQSRAIGA